MAIGTGVPPSFSDLLSPNEWTGSAGADSYNGWNGDDSLVGLLGNDTILGGRDDDLILGGAGADSLVGAVTGGSDTVAEADTLLGGVGRDTLVGEGGDDSLVGGADADLMLGGIGDDVYLLDGADTIVELPGGGIDLVVAATDATLAAHVENLLLTGQAAARGIGNGLANAVAGNAGANWLNGAAGSDTLAGAGGADTLLGSLGDDLMAGGIGADWMVGGDGADALLGEEEDDRLAGGAGADTLDGGEGADRLLGGPGDDIYRADGLDIVIELPGGGNDTAIVTANHVLGVGVEALVLAGFGDIAGTGNALANRIDGNVGANAIAGADGADTLNGASDSDTLSGGGGDDLLTGDSGADLLTGGAGADRFVFDDFESDSLRGADTITDFSRAEGDRIDLSPIAVYRDVLNKNGAFDELLPASDAAPVVAGSLRYTLGAGATTIEGSTDQDAAMEFILVVRVAGYVPLLGDLVL
jgi:Ca2+-binding RTX toxin-like protein